MKCPCEGCEKRHRACHDVCEEFHTWKTERAEERTNIEKQKICRHYIAQNIKRLKGKRYIDEWKKGYKPKSFQK